MKTSDTRNKQASDLTEKLKEEFRDKGSVDAADVERVSVSDIAEKWGIKPLKQHGLSFPSKMDHQFNEQTVRELEQQRNRLLDELMKSTIALEEKFFIAQMEESMEEFFPMLPIMCFNSRSSQKPEKGSN